MGRCNNLGLISTFRPETTFIAVYCFMRILQETASISDMRNAIAAFKAAVQETGTEGDAEGSKFKVEGSTGQFE